jgi:S-adenosylmethionine decarboxylase
MQGLHLTADLRGCDPAAAVMFDPVALQALCRRAVAQSGLTAVAELFHRFETGDGTDAATSSGGGVTGVLLLAESHLAVHTWPEIGAVTIDLYVCNLRRDNRAAAHQAMALVIDGLGPRSVQQQVLQRGVA